ncbi:hypothetical protein H6P81_003644 [Aristolochia fimbriata]|uniref:Uncharacterized protein n=1 Tax=Aristolochia fimbriata TaxID=158543 RepID=A0AAV7FGU1_ARIFI|nr:hypothetical protein H6P81_003644 [Aristolochia fimbriata]
MTSPLPNPVHSLPSDDFLRIEPASVLHGDATPMYSLRCEVSGTRPGRNLCTIQTILTSKAWENRKKFKPQWKLHPLAQQCSDSTSAQDGELTRRTASLKTGPVEVLPTPPSHWRMA